MLTHPLGPCAVHLINNGVSKNEDRVTIEFLGTPDVTSFRCQLDGSTMASFCVSPLRYSKLAPGQHTLVVLPKGCTGEDQGKLTVNIEIQENMQVDE